MPAYEVGELFAERYVVATEPESAAGVTRFVARDNRSHREVVVEVLSLRDPALVSSFEHDMAEVSSVVDAALIPVVGSGRVSDTEVYVATEHLEARTLADALHLGALAAGDAMRMMARLAGALAVAHESGVAHGALHPRYVLLPEFTGRGVRSVDGARLRDLTVAVYKDQVGIASGSPRLDLMYRAPEQLAASPSLVLASDVYAWGIICAHALTGRHPLRIAGTPSTTVEIIARQAGLDVHSALASTPLAPSLRRILERALDVDPDSRHPDGARLAIELAQVGLLDNPPRRGLARGGRPSTPSIVPNVTRFTQTAIDRSGPARPATRMSGLPDDFDVSQDPGFDDLVTMDGEALSGFDDLVELDIEEDGERARLSARPETSDLIARMSSSLTTKSGILLRPSELNMLDSADPKSSAASTPKASGGDGIALNAKLNPRTRSNAPDGEPRVVEIDERAVNENLVPTVDLDGDALGKALSDLDRLDDTELLDDPDATINISELTPHFTYDDEGHIDLDELAARLEAASNDHAAVDAQPAADSQADADDEVVDSSSELEIVEPDVAARPETTEPRASADSPLTASPAGWDAPAVAPRRSMLPIMLVLLLLAGAGAAAVYFFVLEPRESADPSPDEPTAAPETAQTHGTEPSDETRAPQGDPAGDEPPPELAPCERDPEGCVTEALELSTGPAYGRDDTRAAELFEQACTLGQSAAGCAGYASLVRDGRLEGADAATARALVEANCAQTRASSSCRVLASMLADGLGGEADDTRAATLYDQACQGGDGVACIRYAEMLAEGRGVEAADEDTAVALLEKTCDGAEGVPGEGEACFALAMRRRTGDGVRKSGTRYRERLEQGCELGHPVSCKEVADQFRRGKSGRSKDLEYALDLYRGACEQGYGPACTRLCYMENNGEGAEDANPDLAFVHCRYGCLLGDADGCHDAVVILRGGKVTSAPEGEAERLSKRACDLGHEDCKD